MTSPSHYANAGLAESNLPYEILLDIEGVEDETQANASEVSTTTNISKPRTLWKWIMIIVLIFCIVVALLYVSVVAYHHYYHVTPPYTEPFLASPPACDGSIRVENVSLSPFTNTLHFNYVTHFSPNSLGFGWLFKGDAIITIDGKDVQGNSSDVVWRVLVVNFPALKTLEVKNCQDALYKLQGCEAKYHDQYQKHHYPYRYVDLLHRCEKEGFDVNFPSNWIDDLWRGVMYFIHEHQGWFPTIHKKTV